MKKSSRRFRRWGKARFERQLDRIRRLERMLSGENVLIVKLWFHLSKAQMRKRLKKLAGKARSAKAKA